MQSNFQSYPSVAHLSRLIAKFLASTFSAHATTSPTAEHLPVSRSRDETCASSKDLQ